jgi:ribosomal protein S18 acetylase RimI-like enzyme
LFIFSSKFKYLDRRLKLKFITAHESQAESIRSLVNSAYRGEKAKRGWTNDNDLIEGEERVKIESVKKYINADQSIILLALTEDKIVGCVHLAKKDNVCELSMLWVDVDYHNRKIGRELICESEDYAKKVFGCTDIELSVIGQKKELIDYYIRRGYCLTGKQEAAVMAWYHKAKIPGLYIVYMKKKLC